MKVIINDIEYRVDELIIRTFTGLAPFPIEYKDGDFRNCVYDNLQYKIEKVDVIEDSVYINDVAYEFKRIPGTDDFISINGVVYSLVANRFKVIHHRKNGYWSHNISRYGENKTLFTHRLVYEAWRGSILPKYVIDHLDCKKWNNYVTNLEMVTSSVNNLRAFQNNLKTITWTKDQIHMVCRLLEKNYHINQIYDLLGATTPYEKQMVTRLVSSLTRGKTHQDVTSQYDLSKYDVHKNFYTVLNETNIRVIHELLKLNFSQQKIADILGISRAVVESVHLKAAM